MSKETYKSEIEPINMDAVKVHVFNNDVRKAYNMISEYTEAVTTERILAIILAECEPEFEGDSAGDPDSTMVRVGYIVDKIRSYMK